MKKIVFFLMLLSLFSGCNQVVDEHAAVINPVKNVEFPIISKTYFNGMDNDLLSAGLGIAGLQSAAPAFADADSPTREELRRNSIHYNFNALVNTSPAGGFSHLFGPLANKEKIPGHEYVAIVRDQENNISATLLVQVPDNFNLSRPCIVAGPSSGSRGIYGATGIVGPWALSNGCALAYTDKGTGTGFYYIDTGESYNAWGEYGSHQPHDSLFALQKNKAVENYKADFPHRVAIKHAHSATNIEKDWPDFVLHAIRFAFDILNRQYKEESRQFDPENTIVIASGTSNGGGSSVRAAERDENNLIDAVVVAEPNLNMPENNAIRLISNGAEIKTHSRKLLDYSTYISLYLPCALLSKTLSDSPFYKQVIPLYQALQKNRCSSLHKEGLLVSTQAQAQAAESLQRLHDYGILEDSHLLDVSFLVGRVWEGLSAIYTNAYGRYAVDDHICDVSFPVMNNQGKPVPLNKSLAAGLAAISSGFLGTGGIGLSVDSGEKGPVEIFQSPGDQQIADMGLQTALCWRQMLSSGRVQKGLEEITVSGDLHGKPTIIVHGRHDSLIHVNHASRPYYGLNKTGEGETSKLHYYEIENAQHFDKLLAYPDVARHFVPLQFYLEQALDIMLAHLHTGKELPASQVVRTDPTSLAGGSLPAILNAPGPNKITYKNNTVNIP